MSGSQKFIARNRAPRVQIEYDVELYGAQKKVQLPFVMGVLSDLSGKSKQEPPAVEDRGFVEIDVDNFDERMKAMAPRVAFSVPNTLTGEGNLAVDLTFEKMSDFSPGAIAARVDALRPLLEARTQLTNLMTYMDGKSGAETLIETILNDPGLLAALGGTGGDGADMTAALETLRDALPDTADATDGAAEVLDALKAQAPAGDAPADRTGDVLAGLAAAAPGTVAVPDDEAPVDTTSDTLDALRAAVPDDAPAGDAAGDTASAALDALRDAAPAPEEDPADRPADKRDEVLSGLGDLAPPDAAGDAVGDEVSDALGSLAAAAPEGSATPADDTGAALDGLRAAIPDQPAATDATDDVLAGLETPVSETPEADDLDDILGSIEATEAQADPGGTADDVLAGLEDATPDAPEADDLDDILGSIEAGGAAPAEDDPADDVLAGLESAALDETQPEGAGEGDLDDILGSLETAGPDTVQDAATDDVLATLDSAEPVTDGDDDLDDLLGSLDMADPEPVEDGTPDDGPVDAETPVAETPEADDLDDLLADLEATEPEPAGGDTPDDLLADLDGLVSEAPEATDPAADDAGGDDTASDDLDDLLGDLGDADPEPETGGDDLDDLLAELGASDDAEPESGPGEDLDDLVAELGKDETPPADDTDELPRPGDDPVASEDAPDLGAIRPADPQFAFGTISADRPDAQKLNRKRFRMAIFGDFTGRAVRGDLGTGAELAARRPIPLDPDTAEDVIAGFATELVLPIGRDGAGVAVKLGGLDDLHPDEIYENVRLFAELAGLKQQLSSGATAGHAAATLRDWGEKHGQRVAPPKTRSAGNAVPADLRLSEFQKLIGDTSGQLAQPGPLDDLMARIVGPHIRAIPDADAQAMQKAVDEALSSAMRLLLHHPEFQSVEAQWRSIDLIARSIETDDTLDVVLYDVSAAEIAADQAAADDLSQSGLVQLLTGEPLDEENGRGGYSALLGLYTFEETPPHAELLGRIARVAAHVDAPFFAAMTPAFLDTANEDRHPLVARAWDTLRAMPESGHLGLVTPRFLLRRPYGAKTEPIYEFEFEEFTLAEGLRGMLWANPVLLVAILLARSFRQNGAHMGLGSIMSLGGMPYHYVTDRYGDQVALPCTERNMAEDGIAAALGRGFMPVVSIKGRDEVRLASFRSVAGDEILGPWTGQPAPPPSPPDPVAAPEPVAGPDTGDREPVAEAADDDTGADAAGDTGADTGGVDDELDALLAGFDDGGDTGSDDGDIDAELAALLDDL